MLFYTSNMSKQSLMLIRLSTSSQWSLYFYSGTTSSKYSDSQIKKKTRCGSAFTFANPSKCCYKSTDDKQLLVFHTAWQTVLFNYFCLLLFQQIGLDECLKRLNDLTNEAKQKAGIGADVPLKALVSINSHSFLLLGIFYLKDTVLVVHYLDFGVIGVR